MASGRGEKAERCEGVRFDSGTRFYMMNNVFFFILRILKIISPSSNLI